jgi:hypothetical protein
MTVEDDRRVLLAAVNLGELLVELTGIEARGQLYPCPSSEHDQTGKSPPVSLSSNDGYEFWRCHGCGAGGTAIDALAVRGWSLAGAFEELRRRTGRKARGEGDTNPSNPRAHVHTSGCTVEDYAQAKRLPVAFLRELGITDYKDARFEGRVLRIPYKDPQGAQPRAVRLRISLEKGEDGDDRFLWKKGSKPCLYGLWRLDPEACARVHLRLVGGDPSPHMVLVEGESDCKTLWHHGIPALGLPGAGAWKEDRDAPHLDGFDRVYVVVEPDMGGQAVLGWLGKSKIRDRASIVDLGEHKDASGLHLADPEHFRDRWQEALDRAEPWRERAARAEDTERRELASRCAELAFDRRILDRFATDLRRLGIVGEVRLAKLVYLSATSRLLAWIVSVGVKGPSAAGKSVVVERTLEFFPPSAFYVLTAMSERGLIFIGEDMSHRMLVIFEAAGMSGDLQSYLIRSLLSEGRIRYQMAGKGEGGEIVGRVVELEGPTGLICTTTAISLHPENETRLLSVQATDTPEQTKAVLLAIATDDEDDVDLGPWQALQRWLELGEHRVAIPFAEDLAERIPPLAVRLRHDFSGVLGLIRAHALLHQASRERDQRGRIVADLEDYAVVRDLVVDLVSEGVQATVTREVREAVAAVEKLDREHGASRQEIAGKLRLDPSAAGRRLQSAKTKGYLRNLETTRGRHGRWVLGDPLPEDVEILPTAEALEACARVHAGSEDADPPTGEDHGRAEASEAFEQDGSLVDAAMDLFGGDER